MKTGVYGFICSLAIGILFIDKTVTVPALNGSYTGYEKDLTEYVLEVLRFSIKITIVLTVLALLYKLYRKYKH
ncbi:hypothetical protein [Halobacillus amylolyticus]|uniref:Uncharacterized protein n=1 Tax=Halobacillus amylolyticus TaxID=2932259 RepID=A0ABY4HH44_9BACI|nr:hypothetical protein [Halobacillus amylolyticus]UOR13708.1 hypothetical protein MUO15_09840 [Halobacillus amylolyticus]